MLRTLSSRSFRNLSAHFWILVCSSQEKYLSAIHYVVVVSCIWAQGRYSEKRTYFLFLFTEGGGRDSGLHEAPVEILHSLLLHLLSTDDVACVSPELRDQFLAALRRDFPRERVPVVLMPLLHGDKYDLAVDQLNPTSLSLPRNVVCSDGCLSSDWSTVYSELRCVMPHLLYRWSRPLLTP
mgnify:CR=1 FL=1